MHSRTALRGPRPSDTSGDGFLDSVELKLALRVALGTDLPLRECGKIIESVDADGNGTIDWPEFKVSVAQIARPTCHIWNLA